MSSSGITVVELAAALERRFPAAWAEDWDRVGLIVGDVTARITGVLVTLDATAEAVRRAIESGANVLVTHHPPHLSAPEEVTACGGPAGTLEAALRLGVAVISLHTNLDRSPEGASALCSALELTVLGPLESSPERIALVVTYAPESSVGVLREAMSGAGAGRLGEYDRCACVSEGVGYFEALDGARPAAPDRGDGVREVRVEMVATSGAVPGVLAAARAAHPYEEPVILALEGVRARGVARLGRVASWRDGSTLGELADHVGQTLGCACRVWGERSREVRRIAVANGSAGSLMADAAGAADTLVAGEVRYHDALAAVSNGLAVIEAGHDSTEWPMTAMLGQVVRELLPTDVRVTTEQAHNCWWTTEDADARG